MAKLMKRVDNSIDAADPLADDLRAVLDQAAEHTQMWRCAMALALQQLHTSNRCAAEYPALCVSDYPVASNWRWAAWNGPRRMLASPWRRVKLRSVARKTFNNVDASPFHCSRCCRWRVVRLHLIAADEVAASRRGPANV